MSHAVREAQAPQAGGEPGKSAGLEAAPRLIRAWLLACALLVFGVLVVGGITRLTHSGLSIVRWEPVSGVLPPLSPEAWSALFEQYRGSPEFRLVNSAMTLDGFKPIFWWEYAHRLLGRLAGLVFLMPLIAFWATGRIRSALAWRLLGIFCLGALQGALGWYMVASGLVDDPRVSPLRLAAHLAMALLLIGLLLWTAWTQPHRGDERRGAAPAARIAVAAVFLMALSGALVAGTHAGYAYNTFPLMDGRLVPADLLSPDAWAGGPLANLAAVQFLHRALAGVVLAAALVLWWRSRTAGRRQKAGALVLLGAIGVQLCLGVSTLLSGVAPPLAAAHQAGAVVVFACALWAAFRSTQGTLPGDRPRAS